VVLHVDAQPGGVLPTAGGATELTAVLPFSPADVWIIGYAGAEASGETDHAEHWDGHVFSVDGLPPVDPGGPATPNAEPASALEGATAVPGTDGIWAVGWARDPLRGTSHVVHRG
jgi:hypothetical protein